MCGIAAVIDAASTSDRREDRVRRMCGAMLHRGPDDMGIESAAGATLGMRRLAIFDPANGHQPISTRDRRHTLVFNGAIYNHRELREELESAGWVFATRCDTEVLLAALVTWGPSSLVRLRGMFAFALWDSKEGSLFAGRDPFGIKPLYYSEAAGTLTVASEVGALLQGLEAGPQIDPVAIADYLAWLAVPAPRTIYKGILSLSAGECLTFKAGRLELRRWWTFKSIAPQRAAANRPEFIRELRSHLEETIAAHVLSDVPVGAFLSGGLDSAVVAGLMSRVSSNALKTFSIGFEEDGFSEADYAEDSARHFGAVHHTRILTGDEVARDLDSILGSYDQPSGDGVNTYYASQAAREGGVKVALSGLGGDELFGGYPSFRQVPALTRVLRSWVRLPGPLRNAILAGLSRGGVRARKLSDILRSARDPHGVAALQRRVFSVGRQRSMLSPDIMANLGDSEPFHPALGYLREEIPANDPFSLVSAWELGTYMSDVLLRDSDMMSMRHSIELRVPFIDAPLIEWLWSQPSEFKVDAKHPKSVLAEATADILPPGMARRTKRGFTLPFPVWMRRELRPFLDEIFSERTIGRSGLFSTGPIRSLWNEFAGAGEDREWSRVWSLAVLIAFVNRRRP